MQIKKLTFFAILLITIFTGCEDKGQISQDIVSKTVTKAQEKEKEQVKGEPKYNAPTFNLVSPTGEELSIVAGKDGWKFEGIENKIVLLNFFGTWCPPCKAEIPHLNNLREKYINDFEIIAVDVGPRGGGTTPTSELLAFIEDFKIKYPITTGADNGKLFSGVMELNKNGSIPFMLLFNKKGQFVTHYIGMVPEEMLEGDIKKAMVK